MTLSFGIYAFPKDRSEAEAAADLAELYRFESLGTGDHIRHPRVSENPVMDGWSLVAAWATMTHRVRGDFSSQDPEDDIERLRYHPYGDKRGTTETTAGDRTYTGQIDNTATTGLMFYNARYYDPTLRTFISADTIIPNPTSGLGWNRYSYVSNNPLGFIDPSGHCTMKSGIVIDGTSTGPCAAPKIDGVVAGGIWTGADNTVIYFPGNEHTEAVPDAEKLDERVRNIYRDLLALGYDVNVMWVVSDKMTTGILGPKLQIDHCNTFGVNCSALGEDFGAALSAYANSTKGELSAYAHSQASLHVSIAVEQNPALADVLDRLVIAAGTAIDSDGGTAIGKGTVEVWVSLPVVADLGSWKLAPNGPKLNPVRNIPGATPYDSQGAHHSDHLDPSHPVYATAMRLLIGRSQ